MSKYSYYGHDDGLVITQPESGKFVEVPMTEAELLAREPAHEIAGRIYEMANFAGVCYYTMWGIIAKAFLPLEGANTHCHEAMEKLAGRVVDLERGVREIAQEVAFVGCEGSDDAICIETDLAKEDWCPYCRIGTITTSLQREVGGK